MGMIVPIFILLAAWLAAGAVTFGTAERWADFHHGLEVILWSRRMLWPMAALGAGASAVLIGWSIGQSRRRWWLIGLLPVIGLFGWRLLKQRETVWLIDSPKVVASDAATFLRDDDPVAGLYFADRAWAVPLGAMQSRRAIVLEDREHRVVVIYSPAANRLVAYSIDREFKLRDLEYIGSPGGATLLYDRRLGQFINGLTGLTPAGGKPVGFRSRLETFKCPWSVWRKSHPAGSVAQLPVNPLPERTAPAFAVVATTQPIAIASGDIADQPVNLATPAGPLLLLRDKVSGQVRAFDRHLDDDLVVRFVPNIDPKRPAARLLDADTMTGWTGLGMAVDGRPEYQGKRLSAYLVEDGLDFDTMKRWYPTLQRVEVTPDAIGKPIVPETVKPTRSRRGKR